MSDVSFRSASPAEKISADRDQAGERIGWIVRIGLAILLIAVVAYCLSQGTPRWLGASDMSSAATILGISIVFTGVLSPCVFLILMRRNATGEMLEEAAEISQEIVGAEEYAQTIREYRQRVGDAQPRSFSRP